MMKLNLSPENQMLASINQNISLFNLHIIIIMLVSQMARKIINFGLLLLKQLPGLRHQKYAFVKYACIQC